MTTGGFDEDDCPSGEFRLLPLHDEDRLKEVPDEDFEIRHWINDDIEMIEKEEIDSDDDFMAD